MAARRRMNKDRIVCVQHLGGGDGDTGTPDLGVFTMYARLMGRGDRFQKLMLDFTMHGFDAASIIDVVAMSVPVSFDATELASQTSDTGALNKLNAQISKAELEALISLHAMDDLEVNNQYEGAQDANPDTSNDEGGGLNSPGDDDNDADGDLADLFEELLPRHVHAYTTLRTTPFSAHADADRAGFFRGDARLIARRPFVYRVPSWLVVFLRRQSVHVSASGIWAANGTASLSENDWKALLDPGFRETLTPTELNNLMVPFVAWDEFIGDEGGNGLSTNMHQYVVGTGKIWTRSGYGWEDSDL